jgi:environmental stress-induced protein Ves
VRVQRAADRQPQPWRNGRGVQYEITANGALPDGWTWKLSAADITEDVPFSVFAEVSRQFCVADGNGAELTIDGVAHRCEPGSITPFAGDAEVLARLLNGPMKALNLMTRNAEQARLEVLDEGQSSAGAIAVVAIGGASEVDVEGQTFSLGVLDSVLELSGSVVRVASGRAAILMRN